MRHEPTPMKLIASCLALVVAGCGSVAILPKSHPMCQPTPPSLEWYVTEDGGAFYPKPANAELANYIQDLQACLEQYQDINP